MKKKSVSQAPNKPKRLELGKHIVADLEICHGKPTFRGTRIMVWQVLDDVANGRSWDFICNVRWGGRIPLAAVAEAVSRSYPPCRRPILASKRPASGNCEVA